MMTTRTVSVTPLDDDAAVLNIDDEIAAAQRAEEEAAVSALQQSLSPNERVIREALIVAATERQRAKPALRGSTALVPVRAGSASSPSAASGASRVGSLAAVAPTDSASTSAAAASASGAPISSPRSDLSASRRAPPPGVPVKTGTARPLPVPPPAAFYISQARHRPAQPPLALPQPHFAPASVTDGASQPAYGYGYAEQAQLHSLAQHPFYASTAAAAAAATHASPFAAGPPQQTAAVLYRGVPPPPPSYQPPPYAVLPPGAGPLLAHPLAGVRGPHAPPPAPPPAPALSAREPSYRHAAPPPVHVPRAQYPHQQQSRPAQPHPQYVQPQPQGPPVVQEMSPRPVPATWSVRAGYHQPHAARDPDADAAAAIASVPSGPASEAWLSAQLTSAELDEQYAEEARIQQDTLGSLVSPAQPGGT